MFSIGLLSEKEVSPHDGARLGQITIGDFTERFACYHSGPIEELDVLWREQLNNLLSNERSVALAHDQRFAWIFYRENQQCFIQQCMSLEGDFGEHLANRVIRGEDGESISEWETSVDAISEFLVT